MQLLKDNSISDTVKNQNLTTWWKLQSKWSLESFSYAEVSLHYKITSPILLSRTETATGTQHLSSALRHYWEKGEKLFATKEGLQEVLDPVHCLLSLLEQRLCKQHQTKHSGLGDSDTRTSVGQEEQGTRPAVQIQWQHWQLIPL